MNLKVIQSFVTGFVFGALDAYLAVVEDRLAKLAEEARLEEMRLEKSWARTHWSRAELHRMATQLGIKLLPLHGAPAQPSSGHGAPSSLGEEAN